jgi:hypothetical protein
VFVRRPADEVAKLATDPGVVLPIIGGFGRFNRIDQNPDGSEDWDLYLQVGTIHVGGRVRVEPPSAYLIWHSRRGTHHHARIEVTPAEGGAVVRMSVTFKFAGGFTGWLAGLLADGILARHVEAGLEQLRHHIEYGS